MSPFRKISTFPFYPLLLAAFPVLAMWVNNISQVESNALWRPLLVSVIAAALFGCVCRLCTRSWSAAGLITGVWLVLFFSYGHIYNLLAEHPLAGVNLGRHRYLLPVAGLLALAAVWFFRSVKGVLVNRLVNVIGIVLVFFPLARAAGYALESQRHLARGTEPIPSGVELDAAKRPDVYYIILDMYTRADALAGDYGWDNSAFINSLEEMGFYVAGCSRSNYAQTELSLASSLNMEYIQNFGEEFSPDLAGSSAVRDYLHHSRVRSELEALGYSMIAFSSGYSSTHFEDADQFLSPPVSFWDFKHLMPFEAMLVDTTIISTGVDYLSRWMDVQGLEDYVIRQRFILDTLPQLARQPGPKFVLAHIIIPHEPFMFLPDGGVNPDRNYYGKDGKPVDEKAYRLGYLNQVQYINSVIPKILQQILAESEQEPVILLQGDHGVTGRNRLEVLNAYRIPGGEEGLYPSISPVNSFRVVFNRIWDTDLPLLPDRSYYSTYELPFQFTEVDEIRAGCLIAREIEDCQKSCIGLKK